MNCSSDISQPSWWQLLRSMGQSRLDMLSLWQRQHGAVIRLPLRQPTYLLYDPDWIQAILIRAPDQFTRAGQPFVGMRDMLGRGLITGDDRCWQQQRQQTAPWFHPKMLHNYLPIIDRIIEQTMENWMYYARKNQNFDIANEMMMLVLDIITTVVLGDSLPSFLQEMVDLVLTCNRHAGQLSFYPNRYLTLRYGRFYFARRRFNEILKVLISRAPMTADSLLRHRQQQGVEAAQLFDEIKTLLIAGHETTGNLLGFFWYLMGQHQPTCHRLTEVARQAPRARLTINDLQQLSPLQQVLEETMRLYPPVWMIARTLNSEYQMGDHTLPSGAHFFMCLYHLHRSDYWTDANTFKPERFAQQPSPPRGVYAPFGLGPKLCVAKQFAMMQSTYIITRVLQHFNVSVITQSPLTIEALVSLRPQHGVWAHIEPHR